MADEKPYYRCSSCKWSGYIPETIMSLDDMPICPDCHAEVAQVSVPGGVYDEYKYLFNHIKGGKVK